MQVTGKLRGTELTLDAGGTPLTGTVNGDRIEGQGWSASARRAVVVAHRRAR